MTANFTESTVDSATLEWLQGLGYSILYGPDIAVGQPAAERSAFHDVVLEGLLV